ncbi:class I SAM-dependent methyltransferase [Novosphingobium flavum]|uniref:Class I SAM-dependent methyltransferase n=1 Tax=Novosphingobium flavum TaxID=1778672 RepID=A0A7X1FUP0_9SPHN|nr:class I SAM-dependent methyltransferase [Novosphingobium flavum]MBC2667306.1 class I SAM-dependent methyltransferase [Novosphingobium flavum]
MTPAARDEHAALMDESYRWQRHVYDLTRKYYLFGRDRMIGDLRLDGGGSVLEIGCGTGRNLAMVRRRWPRASLFGLDISAEMLKSAQTRLGADASLALGDAAAFDPRHLFGRERFDRVILSYCTSMIPEWEQAVANACRMIQPGGSLHIVDFGAMDGLPGFARRSLLAWLARFHVAPRRSLAGHALMVGGPCGLSGDARDAMGGYYQYVVLTRIG